MRQDLFGSVLLLESPSIFDLEYSGLSPAFPSGFLFTAGEEQFLAAFPPGVFQIEPSGIPW